MPTLPNPRHERFAQELAKGKSGAEAYETAGYSPNRSNANSLRREKHLSTRVSEILDERAKTDAKALEKAAETLGIDKAWVMARLVENVERAFQARPVGKINEIGDPVGGEWSYDGAVANRALELLGKEFGMFIERRDDKLTVQAVTDTPMTAAEWIANHANRETAH